MQIWGMFKVNNQLESQLNNCNMNLMHISVNFIALFCSTGYFPQKKSNPPALVMLDFCTFFIHSIHEASEAFGWRPWCIIDAGHEPRPKNLGCFSLRQISSMRSLTMKMSWKMSWKCRGQRELSALLRQGFRIRVQVRSQHMGDWNDVNFQPSPFTNRLSESHSPLRPMLRHVVPVRVFQGNSRKSPPAAESVGTHWQKARSFLKENQLDKFLCCPDKLIQVSTFVNKMDLLYSSHTKSTINNQRHNQRCS